MDPTGFHANMNYSVRLSGLEPPRNAVEDSTGKLRAMIKTVPQAIHHRTRTHTNAAEIRVFGSISRDGRARWCGKVGEAAQSIIILALKEEVADQVHLIGAVSEGPRHGRQQ